jgi:benzoyl-CoA reductase/2-hydroxyglutaryl-CoA dehydratase subunit BcrC/BadD/HgdB
MNSSHEELESLWKELGLDLALHARILASIEANFRRQVTSKAGRPAGMAYFDDVIHGAHGVRVAEIKAKREAGSKFVGTFCIFVPEEIFLALDVQSLALCGGTAETIPHAEKTFPRNICPLVKSTLGLAFSGTCPYSALEDLAVGETTCDAKKKTWDVLGRDGDFHVLEVPQKKGRSGRELWLDEVRAFARRIEDLTGRELDADRLFRAVRLMNRKRRALAGLHELRKADPPPISGTDALVVMQAALIDDTERFTRALEILVGELESRVASGISPFVPGTRRIILSGCPSVLGNWKVHDLVESAGAVIVADETCTGTRYFSHEVDESGRGVDRLLAAVADRYLKIECSCFTPNVEREETVVRMAKEFKADGVLQYILHACHTYNIEAVNVAVALKAAGVRSLKIETDYAEEDAGPLGLRIEAFLESLDRGPHVL